MASVLVRMQSLLLNKYGTMPSVDLGDYVLDDPDGVPEGETASVSGEDFVDDLHIEVEERDAALWETGLPKGWFSWRRLWAFSGPGFLMCIAYIVSISIIYSFWTLFFILKSLSVA